MKTLLAHLGVITATLILTPVAFAQQVTPPDMTVCDGVTCPTLKRDACSAAGFSIKLTNYVPANTNNNGTASYTYRICSPVAGVCVSTVRSGESCLDSKFCQTKGQNTDLNAYCTRQCATSSFRGLSHLDVTFPALGGACLSQNNVVTGSCKVSVNTSGTATVGNFVLGDGSCFDGGTSQNKVAKCDTTNINPGDCIDMTLNIAGETTGLGLGAAVLVDKESTTCTSSCLAGPSCDRCDTPPGGSACLTRTIGFWGTHPWITNNYVPITVCGYQVGCSGPSDGKSNPSCQVGSKDSVMEALGSIGGEAPKNSAYIAMLKQLAAAKLNLKATATVLSDGVCASWSYGGKTISQWINYCESLCNANDSTISNSGCTAALDAFNNSQDTGFSTTPAPFDRPPVDDFGKISGADPKAFTAAQGNSKPPGKCVIGKVGACK